MPYYNFLLVRPKDKERLKSVLDNQLDQLKNKGINSIEYYTKNLEDPANKKIISYYEVMKASAKKKELTLSIKDIPPLTEGVNEF